MKQLLLPLTSFRFFAVLAVMSYHGPHLGPDPWLPYTRHTCAAVSFFFLLSGFILAYTYHDRFVGRKPGATRDFLVARATRIMSAYVLAFVLSLLVVSGGSLAVLKHTALQWQALTHLTLTQALVPDARWYFSYNPPAWSLSCEWFFYLAFPLVLLGLATGSLLRRVAVFAACSAVWAAALGLYLATPVVPESDHLKWAWLGYVCPLTRLFDFVCGVALGVLFVRVRPEVGPARGSRFWAWGIVELGAVGALWASMHFCPVSPGVGGGPTFAVGMLSCQGYYLPAFASLVWVGALGRGPLSRVMSWAPLVYLGELSYGIYIFHYPVIKLIMMHFPLADRDPVFWTRAVMGISVAAVLALAALSHHFWETPLRRWVRGRPRRPVADEARPPVIEFPQPDRRAA